MKRDQLVLDGERFMHLVTEEVDELDELEFIEKKTQYTDLEKGYEEIKAYIRKLDTDQVFEFLYKDSPHVGFSETNEDPIEGREVFIREVKTIKYIYE